MLQSAAGWLFVLRSLIVLWVITMVIVLLVQFDGRLFPVTSELEIIEISEFEPGWSIIKGRFEKKRECQFLGITWFLGEQSYGEVHSVAVESRFDDKPQVRNSGYQEFEMLRVRLTEDQIQNNSYSIVIHQCYNNFFGWKTYTNFYSSK